MRLRSDLTKYGIVALGGIAILGWIREPERHGSRDLVRDGSAHRRATFVPPLDSADAGVSTNTGRGQPDYATDSAGKLQAAVESHRLPSIRAELQSDSGHAGKRPAAGTKRPEPAPANGGRHEAPDVREQRAATARSREPDAGRSAGTPSVETRAETGDDGQVRGERSQTTPDAAAPGQSHSVRIKQRSTARSAAIIAGAAAAGAAIGGVTGGGKGAAIGAVTGGAGGYVYDRMTRGKNTSAPAMGPGSDSGRRSDADSPEEDGDENRRPSLARRFGTPAFH